MSYKSDQHIGVKSIGFPPTLSI